MKEETKRFDCFDICVDGSGKTTGNLRQDSEHRSSSIVSTWTETEDWRNFPNANRNVQCRPTVPRIPVFI